jgi:hypothetical protein
VRLIHKYAEMIDGVNLSDASVGDELILPERDADVLIAEGWAERAPRPGMGRRATDLQSMASDKPRRKPVSR